MTKTDSSQELSNSKVPSDQLDIWSSILNQKNTDEASQSKTSPYIHPLVKKSKSYLSDKSLEICTESLGSETGSEGFSSSYTSSSSSYDEKLKETVNMVKKPRCFPPPLSSLTSQTQQLQMKPHRDNGRLFMFLQVVSVPSHKNFFSKRQNGRLILSFANEQEEDMVDEFEKEECVIEKTRLCSLESMMNKEIVLFDKNSKWSNRFKRETNFEDVRVVQHVSLSLINGYQYSEHQNCNRNKVVVYGNMNGYQGSNEATQDSRQFVCSQYEALQGSTLSFLLRDPCCITT